MCPSYLATRDEKDSTRGRARVLQEVARRRARRRLARPGRRRGARPLPVLQGLRPRLPDRRRHGDLQVRGAAPGLPPASCRPRSHYTLGRLPRWARLAAPVAPLANASLAVAPTGRLAKSVGRGRPAPRPAGVRPDDAAARHPASTPGPPDAPDVWLWADTFTDHFSPDAGRADDRAARGRRATGAGHPDEPACCGLTWITTGQLDAARKIMARTVATLHPYVAAGHPGRRARAVAAWPRCARTPSS